MLSFLCLDPSTPDFFDYDYDVNVNGNSNFGPGGSALPNGVLPEQAVALSNARSRKARLWRKVYYLQYLRELYRRYNFLYIYIITKVFLVYILLGTNFTIFFQNLC